MPDFPPIFPAGLFLSGFGYDLPEEKIARYPLAERTSSKLLVWNKGSIEESLYAKLPDYIPASSILVFNNSRVVEARMIFQKPSGGQIEIFCLGPHPSHISIPQGMTATRTVLWSCLIGGASKWKKGQVLEKKINDTRLEARFIEKRKEDFIVEFSWSPPEIHFADILHQLGTVPLPPYLKRIADSDDPERYQTVYASESGSVAAPTAGLHFTEDLLQLLAAKGIASLYLTLHVGAGTFMPVKTEKISDHRMHEEYIEVNAWAVKQLISKMNEPVIAVGTTSLRTLETLYWLGLQVHQNKNISAGDLQLDQWFPYRQSNAIPAETALRSLLEWIQNQPGKKLFTKTQLFIVPGYSFKIVQGLITNFHQPHSTLLLLVAALIGDAWKSVYRYALDNGYRFLSFGDGCLFLP